MSIKTVRRFVVQVRNTLGTGRKRWVDAQSETTLTAGIDLLRWSRANWIGSGHYTLKDIRLVERIIRTEDIVLRMPADKGQT